MKRLACLILLVALSPAAYSQSVLYTFDGDSKGDRFGCSVSGAGDVNGDGYADVIVGARWDDNNGWHSGSARVLSGSDGSVLYTFDGDSPDDEFGTSVSGAGDVNGDGYADVIVGAPGDDNNGSNSGSARVFSGVDGSVLYTFNGDSAEDWFGWSVSGAGDVNGDGLHDLIVGAPGDYTIGPASGSARVFSGANGSVLYFFGGDSAWDQFGYSVSGAGYVNGDSYDDVIVGAILDSNTGYDAGSARVFSGLDGTVLYSFDGDSSNDWFGYSVSGAADLNGDGFDELIVGAPGYNIFGSKPGFARVFSGVDGSILYTFYGDSDYDDLGSSVSGAGDVNGDGFNDVIVGVPWDGSGKDYASGSVRVFSGLDGSVLYEVGGDKGADNFGGSVSGAGDVNRDGFADLIVGARRNDNNGKNSGSANVLAGDCGSCALGIKYCGPANLNSTGQSAMITAFGTAVAADNSVTLTADQLPQNVFGYFLNSDVQGFTPFPPGSQGNLCLGGSIGRHAEHVANTGAAGELILDLDLTALPRPNGTHSVVAGETWNFQAWFRDNNGGPTSNFTDGIEIVFN